MDLGLAGKAAFVSGSSRGIGRATALCLAAEGCRVAVSSRGGEDLEATLDAVRARSPSSIAVTADLTTPEGVEVAVATIERDLGGLDILVNNLGGSRARHFDDCDEADMQDVLARNFWPAFRLSRAFVPLMKARGGGVIIHVASIWGREGGGGPSYNVAKAAEISLGKAMARDLALHGIRVNTVAPGSIFFPGGGWARRQQADPVGIAAFVARELPFGRFGRPEEVANTVTFLASPRAAWIAGACIVVDGCQSHMF